MTTLGEFGLGEDGGGDWASAAGEGSAALFQLIGSSVGAGAARRAAEAQADASVRRAEALARWAPWIGLSIAAVGIAAIFARKG